jgi:hypothetical protein
MCNAQRTMRALRVVLTAPALDEDLGFVQRIEEFSVQQLIPQLCSVMPSFRQASAIPIPLPASISTVRKWQMISSAVYRVRAMPPPFVGWNPNSRPDLVYRGQVNPCALVCIPPTIRLLSRQLR